MPKFPKLKIEVYIILYVIHDLVISLFSLRNEISILFYIKLNLSDFFFFIVKNIYIRCLIILNFMKNFVFLIINNLLISLSAKLYLELIFIFFIYCSTRIIYYYFLFIINYLFSYICHNFFFIFLKYKIAREFL